MHAVCKPIRKLLEVKQLCTSLKPAIIKLTMWTRAPQGP
jgi:hypothetical protein